MRLVSFRRIAAITAGIIPLLFFVSGSLRSNPEQNSYSGKEWAFPGGDEASTRYSTLSQINTQNIQQLGMAWSVDVTDQAEAAPIVVSGRMFVVMPQGKIMALDPTTGSPLWTFTPPVPYSGKRGVGVGDGMLFAGLRDSNVIAISQETGQLVWKSDHGPNIPSQGIATAPAYANGVVVAVVSLGDNFLRGRAIGLDAKTGKVLWSWDAVPAPGDKGHETWPQDSDIWKYGGGAIWTTPSVDTDLGLVYIGTGNAVPQFGGELRPGDNLFDNSAVALDIKTGQLRWYFQAIHHDIWEADMSTPMLLYDSRIGGPTRKIVAAMRTDGELFLLDRETGKPVLPVEERPVKQDAFAKTSPTQPYTVGSDKIGPQCVAADMTPPGFESGCFFEPLRLDPPDQYMPHETMRQTPLAYSPQTNFLYAVGCVSGASMRRGPTGWEFLSPVRPAGSKQYGLLAAIDGSTAKIAWQNRLPWSECQGSGAGLPTAGGLLFHLEPDGLLHAYDAKTGSDLWHFQTGQGGLSALTGASTGAAISYEMNGEQYIAIADSHAIMAFKLGGKLPERPAPMPPPTVRPWAGRVEDTANIQLGTTRVFDIASANKKIDFVDDYGLNPTRARITVGATLTFVNKSKLTHTIEARDGSWSTGPIQPGQSGTVTITKPGEYEYTCKDHPWTLGQLTVAPSQEGGTPAGSAAAAGFYTAEQAQRGQMAYAKSCAACHQQDLSGSERIPALAGDAFVTLWQDKTVADLYARTRTTMPQGSAGSLSDQIYADIVAYILRANNFPTGANELPPNEQTLAGFPLNRK